MANRLFTPGERDVVNIQGKKVGVEKIGGFTVNGESFIHHMNSTTARYETFRCINRNCMIIVDSYVNEDNQRVVMTEPKHQNHEKTRSSKEQHKLSPRLASPSRRSPSTPSPLKPTASPLAPASSTPTPVIASPRKVQTSPPPTTFKVEQRSVTTPENIGLAQRQVMNIPLCYDCHMRRRQMNQTPAGIGPPISTMATSATPIVSQNTQNTEIPAAQASIEQSGVVAGRNIGVLQEQSVNFAKKEQCEDTDAHKKKP